ncbi:hypothetical protein BV22DRAFT_411524 [Leucogyrophana mollusca]|uniref:Uncharacterized protein n=1 Tax=Leucogyrophana mollusca TaxID=85980 RepID=A0ACB8BMD1_9AGAM|nr:hypothetical protein BV22DRAFT_411524 [Leucogyrophana mollusca]
MLDARDVGVAALYAKSLLQMVSCLLDAEMSSRFGTCESKSCGCKVADWALRVWHSWMGKIGGVTKPEKDPIGVVMLECARAALRIGAVASCAAYGPVGWGGWSRSCGGPLSWQDLDDFHWTLAFLDHHHSIQDKIVVAGMVVVLSQSPRISLWANEPAFVKAIVVAMGSDNPTRVRHVALRTACEIRKALGSPDNTILPMLSAFSAALRSAVLTNIHPEEYSTTSNSPDRFFYRERDLCYLQIIYALVRSPGGIWYRHLHDDQHFHRCLSIAQHLRSERRTMTAVYLAAIVENLEARGAEHGFTNDDVRLLIAVAWSMVKYATSDLEELLETLIASTWRHRDVSASSADHIKGYVSSTLEHLRQARPLSSMIDPLNELLVSLHAG